jgi:hypothetical protein
MTKPNPNAMPRTEYTRLGGLAVFAKYGVEGMRAFMAARAKGGNSKGGKVQGKINVETGFLDRIRTYEGSRRGGVRQCHERWHVARNKPNPRKCELCQQDLEQEYEKENDVRRETARAPIAVEPSGNGTSNAQPQAT